MMDKGNNKFISKATTCFFLLLFIVRAKHCDENRRHAVIYVTCVDIAVPITADGTLIVIPV